MLIVFVSVLGLWVLGVLLIVSVCRVASEAERSRSAEAPDAESLPPQLHSAT